MLDSASKAVFHLLARNRTLKKLASRYSMQRATSFARRFIAGETVGEAIEAARVVQARGLRLTLDYLGESVATLDAADRATHEYLTTLATHDTAMIELARRLAADHNIASDRFEFQMLYGIRRDSQTSLSQSGYQVRVYIPFGREWFPYFMRRLGERPANVAFVLRGLLAERQ